MSDPKLHDAAAAVVRCWTCLYPQLTYALGGEDDFTRVAVAMNRLRAALPPADHQASRADIIASKLAGIDNAPAWRARRGTLAGEHDE